ncbi:uncharacterized protein J3R85_000061 [Psidium guajava]|nr:uncharacterized protein J3R85_000061 [Psidium guajava]
MASTGFVGIAEEAINGSSGATAEPGPRGASSGFGGLGVEGMVGTEEDPPEAGAAPPGEGRRGATSGESSWKGGTRGSDDRVGEDGIAVAGVAELSSEERDCEGRARIAEAMIADASQEDAILMIKK